MIIDLEIADFINNSPNVPTRTPGQLLSLTSHFSFVSNCLFYYFRLVNATVSFI